MKLFFFASLLIFFQQASFSQATPSKDREENEYRIKFQVLSASNFEKTQSLLVKLTEPTEIEFNTQDSVFVLSTYRELDHKVIAGKLLKNYFPVAYIIKVGGTPMPFPQMQHTGDDQKDQLLYEQQKTEWIRLYPVEYQKMASGAH